jgi:hypothetical protein
VRETLTREGNVGMKAGFMIFFFRQLDPTAN